MKSLREQLEEMGCEFDVPNWNAIKLPLDLPHHVVMMDTLEALSMGHMEIGVYDANGEEVETYDVHEPNILSEIRSAMKKIERKYGHPKSLKYIKLLRIKNT